MQELVIAIIIFCLVPLHFSFITRDAKRELATDICINNKL